MTTAETSSSTTRVLPTNVREVSGSDKTLAEAVTSQEVPRPDVMDFNTWQVWRKGVGRRPTIGKGDPQVTSSKNEADLWRATMERYHGKDWRVRLEEAQLAAAEAAEEARKASVKVGESFAKGVFPTWAPFSLLRSPRRNCGGSAGRREEG